MASRDRGGRRQREPEFARPRLALGWLPLTLLCVLSQVFLVLPTASSQTLDVGLENGVRVDEADVATRAHLARADQAAREKQWDESIDALLRAIDAEGERLLPADQESEIPGGDSFVRYLPVRGHVQRRIAELVHQHPAAARAYRRRVDAVAERMFDEALTQTAREPAYFAWERLLRTLASSSVGDEAWRRYGEARLERGDHHLARAAWEQLSPLGRTLSESGDAAREPKLPRLPGDRSWWWTFRAAGRLSLVQEYDSAWFQASPLVAAREAADASARLVLVSIFAGERERAAWELARFERIFSNAEGELSGRRAPWSKLLAELLAKSADWSEPPPEPGWPCLGGEWSRNGSFATPLDLSGKAIWSGPLAPVAPPDAARDLAGNATSAVPPLLSVHPVVVGPYVVVQDGAGLKVWRADSGEPAFGDDPSGLIFSAPLQSSWLSSPNSRVVGVPRFPLAIAAGRAWARVGAPWLSQERPVGSDLHPARMVAIDLAAEGRVGLSWTLDKEQWGDEWTWEGPPVVVDGRAYAGLRRCDPVQSQSHVACWDVGSGKLQWRKFVAAASTPRARRSVEWTQQLLTYYEGRLFYQARVGVVACLNPADGAIEWLTRYPLVTAEQSGASVERFRTRDLAPCVVRDGLVVVAAADQPKLFALEAATGRLVWIARSPNGETATHLLGMAAGQVIASGDSLTWLDAGTGEQRCQFPAPGVRDLSLQGFGRGLIAGDQLWWPTREAILVFSVVPEQTEQGWRPRALRRIELKNRGAVGGNLVSAAGMLFIASPDRLYAFGP